MITDQSLSGTYPLSFKLNNLPNEILNQGVTGSCVAHAIAVHANVKEKMDPVISRDIKFSTEFIYGLRLADQYFGVGMYIRDAAKNSIEYGLLPYEYLKGNNEYQKAAQEVISNIESFKTKSIPFRNSEYCRCDGIDNIKSAILSLKLPVIVNIKVTDDFYNPNSDGTANIPTDFSKAGGHCMLIYGWNEKGWIIRNSWGKNYGLNGDVIVPFNYPISEAWALYDCNALHELSDVHITKWYYNYVYRMYYGGYMCINPSSNNKFNPDGTITLKEFLMIIYRVFLRRFKYLNNKDYKFDKDLYTKEAWYSDAINLCLKEGIITEEETTDSNLDSPLLRWEAFDLLCSLIKNRFDKNIPLENEQDLPFSDLDEFTYSGFSDEINNMKNLFNLGIIEGSSNKIRMFDNITRAETAKIFDRFLTVVDKY